LGEDLWQVVENHLAQNDYDNVQLFGGIHVYELSNLLRDHAPIITPYESYSLYLRRLLGRENSLRSRLNLWIAQQYERFMFTPYQKVVVLSEADRDELHSLNPALSLEVIPNGIDLEFFTQGEDQPREAATLLFVGNYEYAPNVDAARLLVQEILPRVRQAIPDARLQLVGNAPPPELLALASDAVEITGRVPDVRPYLAQATAFVCPLRLGAGLKNKVLEALAMGIPVVATPLSVDGISVVHNESALVISLNEIATETVRLLDDVALQKTLSQNGRRLIETHYSWQGVANRYDWLYKSVQAVR
ncbi:MAG: glycosyltransferase, partial [Anaerolineae bacterium]|nr:glycosyltransferase [Anaerolineae bacterium]